MKSTYKQRIDRQQHFYGDSHMAGYESDHDQLLNRNTFREKRDLIAQLGLHQAIMMWNVKMGRASKMSVYEFAHRNLRTAYPYLLNSEARVVTWPAMSADYLHLLIKKDYYRGELNSYDHVYIGIPRPTRTYKLDLMGAYDFKNEDLDGKAGIHTDSHYAITWAIHMTAIKDFLAKKNISYKFIQHFDIFDDSVEDIHVLDVPEDSLYYQMFTDTWRSIIVNAVPKRLDQFGKQLGFYHRNAEAHKQFAAYLKNYLT